MVNPGIIFITRTAIIIAFTLGVMALRLPQFFTGPIVNLSLYMAVYTVNPLSGVFVGISTPVVAIMIGIIPSILAPMVPFIMLGNSALSLTFGLLMKRNKIVAIILASTVKFLLLAISARIILPFALELLKIDIPQGKIAALIAIFTLPQLLTALAGGFLALAIMKVIRIKPLG